MSNLKDEEIRDLIACLRTKENIKSFVNDSELHVDAEAGLVEDLEPEAFLALIVVLPAQGAEGDVRSNPSEEAGGPVGGASVNKC